MNKKSVITSREGERETHTDGTFSFNHKMHLLLKGQLWAASVALASGPAAPDWPGA